ncbi:hypothetical protein [Flavihumibacter profundi]|uniref:hypothetical protein n=1 Tax=Flavihumibacter profundi TaxID=2716883 RepID=UPI001CC67E53|nr:hypothetical protein [Flavihumibacter profundi]MBZ5857568.1 hypothetical protein [Flavihumibacter profundi]
MNKPPLLLSLGANHAVAIQAYYLFHSQISSIHILGTDNPRTNYQALDEFFSKHSIDYTITIIKDYGELKSVYDHLVFEECLLRWYLHYAANDLPLVCISGGIKSMSAAFQKVAQWLGAEKVFHTIAEGQPASIIEIENAIAENKIITLDMGSEPGWPAFRSVGKSYPAKLISIDGSNSMYYLWQPVHQDFLQAIQSAIKRIQKLVHLDASVDLPFSSLNLLPGDRMQWLQEELQIYTDRAWICSLPKLDLHCHLGGFASSGELLKAVRSRARDPLPKIDLPEPLIPKGWPYPNIPLPLDVYMQLGNATGSALLKDSGCLDAQVELLYDHFISQGIRYAEVRCSPDNYKTAEKSSWQVLQDIIISFQACMARYKDSERFCHVNLLLIATRKKGGDRSSISRHLALAITATQHQEKLTDDGHCKVVGVDLAGFESEETRAGYFVTDFVGVHRCGLAVTAHAGENDDSEGIWQAVFNLNVRRLGHGLRLLEAPELLKSVANRGIGVEMCPYANYQIRGFYPMAGKEKVFYPLREYLQQGVLVTVNTDNIGISAANITDNFLFLSSLCPGITRMEILQLIRNSIEVAFISSLYKKKMLAEIDKAVFISCISHLP